MCRIMRIERQVSVGMEKFRIAKLSPTIFSSYCYKTYFWIKFESFPFRFAFIYCCFAILIIHSLDYSTSFKLSDKNSMNPVSTTSNFDFVIPYENNNLVRLLSDSSSLRKSNQNNVSFAAVRQNFPINIRSRRIFDRFNHVRPTSSSYLHFRNLAASKSYTNDESNDIDDINDKKDSSTSSNKAIEQRERLVSNNKINLPKQEEKMGVNNDRIEDIYDRNAPIFPRRSVSKVARKNGTEGNGGTMDILDLKEELPLDEPIITKSVSTPSSTVENDEFDNVEAKDNPVMNECISSLTVQMNQLKQNIPNSFTCDEGNIRNWIPLFVLYGPLQELYSNKHRNPFKTDLENISLIDNFINWHSDIGKLSNDCHKTLLWIHCKIHDYLIGCDTRLIEYEKVASDPLTVEKKNQYCKKENSEIYTRCLQNAQEAGEFEDYPYSGCQAHNAKYSNLSSRLKLPSDLFMLFLFMTLNLMLLL